MKTMYKNVATKDEEMIFNNTWMDIADEVNCVYRPLAGEGFLISSPNGEGIGTIEFTSFIPHNNQAVDTYYSFSNDENMKSYGGNIFAIGKLGIKKEARGSQKGNFQTLMEIIIEHQRKNNVKYYIATLNKEVYRALLILHRPKVVALSKQINLDKISIYPVVIHMEETIKRLENQKWYQERFLTHQK